MERKREANNAVLDVDFAKISDVNIIALAFSSQAFGFEFFICS